MVGERDLGEGEGSVGAWWGRCGVLHLGVWRVEEGDGLFVLFYCLEGLIS